ncbi:MAG: AraC family transcriptional regulator [Alkaliphilus sp.]
MRNNRKTTETSSSQHHESTYAFQAEKCKTQDVLVGDPLKTSSDLRPTPQEDVFPSEGVIKLNDRFFINLNNYHLNSSYNQIQGHSHHLLEISYIKKGAGKYHIDNTIYDIQQGDVFIINNIEKHGIVVNPNNEMLNMVIHFEPRFIWSVENNFFDSRYLKIFYDRSSNFQNKLDRNNPATQHISSLLLEIEAEFFNKLPEYELMVKVKLLNLLVLLIRHYNYVQDNPKTSAKNRQELLHINKVIDYIDQNYKRNIRLEELANLVFMNPSYFSTFFKKYNGISPTEYIARKRVYRAIEYLKSTNKTVLDIAITCGFNNTSSFNKVFRKITGKTPSGYR